MKKTLSLFLALIFALGICFSAPVTINANALESQDVNYSVEASGFSDGKITFSVFLAPNQTIDKALVSVKYDPAVLSVSSAGAATVTDSYGELTESVPGVYEHDTPSYSNEHYTFAYINSSSYKIGTNAKKFVEITFQLKDGAGKEATVVFLNGDYTSESVIKSFVSFSTLSTPEISVIESKANGLRFSWSSVEGAEGYNIYKKTGTDLVRVATVANQTTSFTDVDAVNKQTNTYAVTAMDSDGRETLLKTFEATYDFSLEAPEVTLAAEKGGIRISWNSVANAETYDIYRSAKANNSWSALTKIATVSAEKITYVDTTVLSGGVYKYAVSAVAGAHKSEQKTSNDITYLTAPVIVSAESSAKGITVTWNKVNGAKGYDVFKKTRNGFEKIGSTTENALAYTDKDVVSEVTYTYVVAAKDANGNISPYSDESSVYFEFVLESPVAQVERVKGGIEISWELFPGVTGYKIYRAELGSDNAWSQWSQIGSVGENVTKYLDKNVASNGVYTYAVASLCDIGESKISVNNSILYIGEPVINLAKSTERGVTFTWSSVEGSTGFIIYKKVGSEMVKLTDVDASTTAYTDTGVESGKAYTYAVAALDRFGQPGFYTEFTVKVNLAIPAVKVANTAKGIKVTWNKIANAEKYVVYQRTYNAKTKKWSGWKALKTTTGLSYVDTTVKIGTNYRYTVKAVKGSSASKFTSTGTIKYNVVPSVKVANTSSGVKVTWSTVANATGYTIYSSTYNAKTKKWSSWKNRGTAGKNKTAWVDKSAKSGTYYRYTVRARYGSAASSFKASANILRLANPTVKAVKASNGVKVTWNKIAGAKNYKIYRATYTNGKWSGWSAIKTTNNKTFAYVDKTAKKGVYYKYTVRAVNGKSASAYTASKNVKR